ncbi:MAG: protein disulfide isomerase family protein [Patescibacteria group bacterium]
MKDKGAMFGLIVLVVIVVAGIAIGAGKGKGSDSSSGDASANNSVSQDSSGMDNSNIPDGESGESAEYKEKLAKFLAQRGAVMYGAYWCPHCKSQKKAFGDAFKYVNYVECDASGENANPDECAAKGITGYPTWIYQGKSYSGFRSLSQLAQMVDFSSSTSQSDESIDDVVVSDDEAGDSTGKTAE